MEPSAADAAGLVRRARAGDAAAYERLYRSHVGRVFALCLRLSGDSGRAHELTQDVFVQAWRKLDLLRADEAFASWLYRLTVNLALMSSQRQRRTWSRESGSDDLAVVERVRGAVGHNVGAKIDLERAVAKLPGGARAVFILHDVEGYRHEEIAERMRIAVGTSKAQLHRARRLLREVLGQ